mmetsp:Transcript_62216/g.115468  ORF Transcript_62216/g.115468 Transcript_62216/m.115468 type:complete len:120 (+) Transcript_62216:81-440(+)
MGNYVCKQICNRQGERGDVLDSAGKSTDAARAKRVIEPRPVWSGVPSKEFVELAPDVAAVVSKLPKEGASLTASEATEVFQAAQKVVGIVESAPSSMKPEAWAISNAIWGVAPSVKVQG